MRKRTRRGAVLKRHTLRNLFRIEGAFQAFPQQPRDEVLRLRGAASRLRAGKGYDQQKGCLA